jgi:hypothetical protein
MESPYDILYGPEWKAFDPRMDELIRTRAVAWLWLAPPCGSFSGLRTALCAPEGVQKAMEAIPKRLWEIDYGGGLSSS